ncbi:MAG: MFS transporter [Bacteroidota bacterium]
MTTRLLLIVIYLAFISLGLPDSLLGPAWPSMYMSLSVPVHYAGIISMIVAAGTVVSSLLSANLIKRFGVAAITTFSVLLTALALLGFSLSQHFFFLCLLAIPLGLGAGSVDAALNNYVALHYEAKHMNWLHCFWGVGAAIGPLIMSGYLARNQSWTMGYRTVGWIQVVLVIILFISFPLWIKDKGIQQTVHEPETKNSFKTLLAIPGLKQVLIVFFCYCTIEATFGLWGASYLVFVRGLAPDEAARLVSFFYIGITVGRFLSGFIAGKLNNRQMVYGGQCLIVLGLVVLLLPFQVILLPGFFLVGLGCAPIFPSLLHETPRNFGEKYSQAIMGIQMASAYIGITLMPLLFGRLASSFGYSFFLWFIGIVLLVKVYMNYILNRIVTRITVD